MSAIVQGFYLLEHFHRESVYMLHKTMCYYWQRVGGGGADAGLQVEKNHALVTQIWCKKT